MWHHCRTSTGVQLLGGMSHSYKQYMHKHTCVVARARLQVTWPSGPAATAVDHCAMQERLEQQNQVSQ